MTELELELRARELIGETIEEVHYQQLPWRSAAVDLIDIAIHLRMQSGARFRVGWGDEFGLHHGNGITIAPIRRIDNDAGPLHRVEWPVATITGAAIRWQSVDDALRDNFRVLVAVCGDYLRRRDYPHALDLDLGNRRVVVACDFTNRLRVSM